VPAEVARQRQQLEEEGREVAAAVRGGRLQEIAQELAILVYVAYGTALAYTANPTRFTRRPHPPKLPTIAWINQPIEEVAQSA